MVDEIINEREKAKINFIKTQAEKYEYLGEFKERVLIALEKQDIEKGIIHTEIIEKMKDSRASLLKIRRDISLDLIKPYIDEAEKIDLRYMLVDDISFRGEIGLVVVSKEALNNENENVIAESITKVFVDAGLSEGFAFALGKKICPKHYDELKEKLPDYLDRFQEMSLFDRIFGKTCPIEMYEKKEKIKRLKQQREGVKR